MGSAEHEIRAFTGLDTLSDAEERRIRSSTPTSILAYLVVIFAMVHGEDLDSFGDAPLSLKVCSETILNEIDSVHVAFQELSRLLLGHMSSVDYVYPAFLVTA